MSTTWRAVAERCSRRSWDPATTPPCLVNRVGNDDSMSRAPTSEVEPGQWMVFTSSDDLPASVVVRDDSGTVVFEQRAHARPTDDEELMALQDSVAGDMDLSLDEGADVVECRTSDGTATAVPLRVAWDTSGAVDQSKRVILRISDTPYQGE